MTSVVISQPMYAPWPGFLELVSLADIFVVFDDVQMPLGRSFTSRVQVKVPEGRRWMTVPVRRRAGQLIKDVEISDEVPWQRRHVQQISSSLKGAPFASVASNMIAQWMASPMRTIRDLDHRTLTDLMSYFGIEKQIVFSSELGVAGSGTERLVKTVKALGGLRYVTAHGASNYMEHEAFEREGIDVDYVRYSMTTWTQGHGIFTPYVTTLDLIGHHGPNARDFLHPSSIPWRKFLEERQASVA